MALTYRQKSYQTEATICITIDKLWESLGRSSFNFLSHDQTFYGSLWVSPSPPPKSEL